MAAQTGTGKQRSARRSSARRTEQIAILSAAIVFGLLGFPLHGLWIVAVVLMVLLWAYMAADITGSRRNGKMISDVVTTIGDEVQFLATGAPGPAAGPRDESPEPVDQPAPADQPELVDQAKDLDEADDPQGDREPTKKDLYDEARKAGIEGRSTMSKEELQQALDD